MAAGAVAVIAKPNPGLKQFLQESRSEVADTLKGAARAKSRLIKPTTNLSYGDNPIATKPSALASGTSLRTFAVNKPVVIGSSTGGTQALE